MQILLIADIHANAAALEAVLDKYRDADEVWCLGDIVLCGPSPARCIELVRSRCRYAVQGNHDLEYAEAAGTDRPHDCAEDVDYLLGLPGSVTVEVDGRSYCLVHNAPAPLTKKLLPTSEMEYIEQALGLAGANALLSAHSHIAMVMRVGKRMIVNPGTIGQPRDRNFGAQCMLIEDGAFRFDRVKYDVAELVRDYQASSMPADDRQMWLECTRTGFIDSFGLQRGPFSGSRRLVTPKAVDLPQQEAGG